MPWKESVVRHLKQELKSDIRLLSSSPVGGGDINDACKFVTSSGVFFVKKNSASRYPQMFRKESLGLQLLAKAGAIDTPVTVTCGEVNDTAFLVLKFIESAPRRVNFWEDFGRGLARLHKHTDEHFGLNHDNYIGSLYQSNRKHESWAGFFSEERLGVQVKMARDRGKIGAETVKAFERFYKRIEEIFPEEPPALVHGDLWGGNFMINEKGSAVIIDPAVYYGHREMDLGMSQLFGGFSAEFYEAYHAEYPLEKNWQHRIEYCNLYPLMVHVNLFGGGYLNSVKSILNRF